MTDLILTSPTCSTCGNGTRHDHNPAAGRVLCYSCASKEQEMFLTEQAADAEEEAVRRVFHSLFPKAAL